MGLRLKEDILGYKKGAILKGYIEEGDFIFTDSYFLNKDLFEPDNRLTVEQMKEAFSNQ